MKSFVDHLNCFNLNESQYWVVPDIYRRHEFEVSWFRTATGDPVWKIRVRGENTEWQEFTNADVVVQLSECGVDLVELRNQIAETVLRQAIYAAQISKSARELLGDQTIDSAVADNELFVSDLVGKIKSMLGSETSAKSSKHLRLVPVQS